MEIQSKHIRAGESRLRCGGEKQLVHDPCSQDAKGRFGGGGGRVGCHNQAHPRATRKQCEIGTIEERPLRSTLWMSRLGVWRQSETGSNRRQIKQALLFAPHDNPHPRRERGSKHGHGAIQSVQTNQQRSKGHTEPTCIADDGLTGSC